MTGTKPAAHDPQPSHNPAPANEPAWHTLSTEETARRLGSDLEFGLAQGESARRHVDLGPNALAVAKGPSLFSLLVHQFRSLIVVMLLAAAAVAFGLGETIESAAILVVIVLNAGIGLMTEWKAEEALAALRKQAVLVATAVRDGVERQVPVAELVAGDLVVLSAGDRVPADGRLVQASRLQVEEAALTGESASVTKNTDPVLDPHAQPGDRPNSVYMGTAVADGRGRFIVTAIGMRTEFGKIGALIEGADTRGTPLEAKLAQLGRSLLGIVLALCAVIVLTGWLRGNQFLYMLEVGISLAIAAVPEGLPAVVTMTLALGMQRMARRHALVRRLPAVETLGSTTVICTDKTGTLTRNEMTVRELIVDRIRVEVTGTGYGQEGGFEIDTGGTRSKAPLDHPVLHLALRIGALCNDASVDRSGEQVAILGDPTEAAMIVAAEKAGLNLDELERAYARVEEIPFNSKSQRMVTIHRAPDNKTVAYVKGAPGVLLHASSSELRVTGPVALEDEQRRWWEERNREMAGRALRVLALACRQLPEGHGDEESARDLTFVGLVGMIDPLRDEARAAIDTCHEAGIRTCMLTGDQQATAAEIARQLGIDQDSQGRALRTVHASELGALDAAGWQRLVEEAAVFARVSPEHKLKIVEALQHNGHIVAMTGDGVNDAPALKQADIGIAMGIKGTEVAKEAADMVMTDDNFATIVGAVEQGRIIFFNIIRFIHFLFSCNLSEIVVVFTAIMIGWPLPIGPLQILWLNMVTDVLPALALALEPSSPGIMKRPPRNPDEPLMSRSFIWLIAWQGLLLAGLTLTAFFVGMRWYGATGEGLRHAVTLTFMTLAAVQIVHAFNARSRTRSAFSAPFSNGWLWGAVITCLGLQVAAVYVPVLRTTLRTVPLTGPDWALVGGCAFGTLAVVELSKLGPFGSRQ